MATLTKGSNKIVTFTLYESDGVTPKPVSDFSMVVALITQFSRLLSTYTLGTDNEIREGSSSNIVEVEIDTALSATFREGAVTVKLSLDETDADFTEDGFHRCIPEEEAFTVI